MPNATPAVSAAGQVCRRPRRPSTTATSTSGTTTARIGVCRPTMAPSVSTVSRGSSFAPWVTVASVRIGVANAPKATGAVLAMSDSAAACSGRNPNAISIATVIATGVPNPANASISAPKQNAMMIAWMRMSGLTRSMDRRSTAECPLTTVRLYTQIALMTIQRIGKKPNVAPSLADSSACPTGIE
jgi:hypothetical protein